MSGKKYPKIEFTVDAFHSTKKFDMNVYKFPEANGTEFFVGLHQSVGKTIRLFHSPFSPLKLKMADSPALLFPMEFINEFVNHEYIALINRAEGPYGRILTEVVSADRKQ